MASDAFTDTNGTALFTHDSNWGHADSATLEPEIQSNYCIVAGDWNICKVRYTTSTEDTSEAVFRGHAGTLRTQREVCVRMSTSVMGYGVTLTGVSGTDYTTMSFSKDGAWQSSVTGLTIDGTSDQTVKVTAEDSGANVIVRAYLNDVEQGSWTDTTSVYASGNPGFHIEGNGVGTREATSIDDWTDNAGAGATSYLLLLDQSSGGM